MEIEFLLNTIKLWHDRSKMQEQVIANLHAENNKLSARVKEVEALVPAEPQPPS